MLKTVTVEVGYTTRQTARSRIEGRFGRGKTIGGLRKRRFIGREKPDIQFVMTYAAGNLIPSVSSYGIFYRKCYCVNGIIPIPTLPGFMRLHSKTKCSSRHLVR